MMIYHPYHYHRNVPYDADEDENTKATTVTVFTPLCNEF